MAGRGAPVHIMRWAPQDWLSSSLRGELALTSDHLSRAVYRDLLDVLHNRGGYIERSRVAGACLVQASEAEQALKVLLAAGAIEETDDGRIFNARVLADLASERDYQEEKRGAGSRGGEARARTLTAERRSEIAREAAKSRWGSSDASGDASDANPSKDDACAASMSKQDACPPAPAPAPTPAPKKEEHQNAADAARASDPDPIDLIWPEVAAAFAMYGRRLELLNESRRRQLRGALRDIRKRGPQGLVDTVHGYMAFHSTPRADYDPMQHFTPETVFRATLRAKYLEAYDRAIAEGREAPFLPRAKPATYAPGARTPSRSDWERHEAAEGRKA